jgi:hypothetical protein
VVIKRVSEGQRVNADDADDKVRVTPSGVKPLSAGPGNSRVNA